MSCHSKKCSEEGLGWLAEAEEESAAPCPSTVSWTPSMASSQAARLSATQRLLTDRPEERQAADMAWKQRHPDRLFPMGFVWEACPGVPGTRTCVCTCVCASHARFPSSRSCDLPLLNGGMLASGVRRGSPGPQAPRAGNQA